jgi:pantoate--beta-alanine ligase
VEAAAAAGPVVVSIFVNPTQFGPQEDLAAYPRDLGADLALLAPLGVKAVFAPEVDQMYGAPGEVSVQPGRRGLGLCGEIRPGHFAGVLTVVAKLFGLVRPGVAVFGRKDAQQCLVIRQMVEDLHLPVGLAMSSRNRYLNAVERQRARCLWRSLTAARFALEAGERSTAALQKLMWAELAMADQREYAEIRQVPDLERPTQAAGTVLLAVAARVGPARLIDNLVLNLEGDTVRDSHLMGRL